MKIGILNYDACNLSSIYNTIYNLGYDPLIIEKVEDFRKINKLIIPGVGSANHCISYLNKNKLFDVIIKYKNKGMPILGICLGMQIFADKLYEHGKSNGLGFIRGEVIPLVFKKKFNIGWKDIKIKNFENNKFNKIFKDKCSFFFCHSYYFKISENSSKYIVASTSLDEEIPAIISQDNVLGVQFHPEKSQTNGINFLKYFVDWF